MNSYQEWKNCWRNKYRYQEIWKEYKVFSRFQEMQQWESWHNERDQTILEEMAPLLKEEPSKEVFKLRTYTNGKQFPVAPSRITELREQFEIIRKIMERCSPLLEEQNAERQRI